jgi:hypothetical protein
VVEQRACLSRFDPRRRAGIKAKPVDRAERRPAGVPPERRELFVEFIQP